MIVSALVPYKRLDLPITLFRQPSYHHRQLLIIGQGPEESRLRALANNAPNIQFLGWQSDEQVRLHYQQARAFLFPGEEDFGLTPLEAQACGTPVIAYAKGGALETITPHTGLFFPHQTPASLHQAIEKFESQQHTYNPATLHQHAAQFSWTNFQSKILKITTSLLSPHP